VACGGLSGRPLRRTQLRLVRVPGRRLVTVFGFFVRILVRPRFAPVAPGVLVTFRQRRLWEWTAHPDWITHIGECYADRPDRRKGRIVGE